MKDHWPPKILQAIQALTTTYALCSPALRQAILTYAQNLASKVASPETIPAELIPYVDKIVLYAHRITDDDIQALKSSGYSEDQVYEITLCATLGASLARVERGLAALKGA